MDDVDEEIDVAFRRRVMCASSRLAIGHSTRQHASSVELGNRGLNMPEESSKDNDVDAEDADDIDDVDDDVEEEGGGAVV